MRTNLMITTAALLGGAVLAASPAYAVEDVWNFGAPTGNLGNTHTYLSSPDSVAVIASGFTTGGATVNLFGKNNGGDEIGVGLTNDTSGDNEITPGSFVQVDLASLPAGALLTVSFMANSTTGGEGWQVFGSNTAGTIGTTSLLTGSDELNHTLNASGFRFIDVTATTGNMLLSQLDAPITPAVPEPLSLSVLGVGLLGLGAVRWNRRKG